MIFTILDNEKVMPTRYILYKKTKTKISKSKHIAGGTHIDMVKDEVSKSDPTAIGPGGFHKAILEGSKFTKMII